MVRAQRLAVKEKLPLHVCVCLHVPRSELSTLRHYSFLLKGLREVSEVRGVRSPAAAAARGKTLYSALLWNRNASPWTWSSTCCTAPRGTSCPGL